jgi:hypothetical protein
MHRNTQWIKGIEFYEPYENLDNKIYNRIEEILKLELPDSFKNFYNQYIPITPFESQYFLPEVVFEDSNSIIRTTKFKDLYLGEVYILSKIIERIENEGGEINPFIELGMLPIAEGTNYHNGILMDEFGVFYYAMDFHEFMFQDDKSESIIAREIYELISQFMIIPFGEMTI